jgi:hypothetical protein
MRVTKNGEMESCFFTSPNSISILFFWVFFGRELLLEQIAGDNTDLLENVTKPKLEKARFTRFSSFVGGKDLFLPVGFRLMKMMITSCLDGYRGVDATLPRADCIELR